MFDERAFPYIYECTECPDRLLVTKREAVDVAFHCATPANAANFVRQVRGWHHDRDCGLRCPSCVAEA